MRRIDSASFNARIGRFDNTRQASRPPPGAAVRRAQRALSAQGLACHPLPLLLLLASCAPRAVGNTGITRPASRDTRCDLPSVCSAAPHAAVAAAFPHAFQRLSVHSQSASCTPGSTAFLLPSAAAAKGKAGGPAAKPGPPPKLVKPAVAGKSNAAARRPSAFQGQRRGPERALRRQSTVLGLGDNISPMEESKSGPRVAAAGAAITSNNADPLFAPLSKKKKPMQVPSYASGRNDRAPALNVSATVTVRPSPTTRDAASPSTGAVVVTPTPRFVPTCMLFHDAQQAVRQIRKSRRAQPSLIFCIHPKATPLFAGALSEAIRGTNGRGDWLSPFAVQHQIPAALRQHPVHKLTGLGQRQAPVVPARRTVPLGSDTLVSVLTISLRKDNHAPDVDAAEAHLLTRNSFRLLRHTDLAGAQRLFIAYFVNRDNEVGAGHLEVIKDEWGMFSVEHAATGFVFSAGSLRGLVDHLQDISACRCLDLQEPEETPPETTPQASTEEPAGTTTTPLQEPADLIPMRAGNLFVHEEETLSWTAPHPHLPYRRGVDLLDTVAVGPGDQNASHLLFRNTFTLIPDGLVYVDDLGRAGTLRVIADRRTGARHLRCAQPQDLDLAVRCGLYEGAIYSVAELVAALQSSRMLQIDDPPPATTAPAPAEEAGNTTDRVALPDEPPPDGTPPRLPRSGYTFDPDAAILRYVDPEGRDGALLFKHVSEPHAGFLLRPPSTALAGRFAQRNRIDVGVVYTEGELVWHLDGEGYAREGLLA